MHGGSTNINDSAKVVKVCHFGLVYVWVHSIDPMS